MKFHTHALLKHLTGTYDFVRFTFWLAMQLLDQPVDLSSFAPPLARRVIQTQMQLMNRGMARQDAAFVVEATMIPTS